MNIYIYIYRSIYAQLKIHNTEKQKRLNTGRFIKNNQYQKARCWNSWSPKEPRQLSGPCLVSGLQMHSSPLVAFFPSKLTY